MSEQDPPDTEENTDRERYELELKLDQALDDLFRNPNIPDWIKKELMQASFGRMSLSRS